MVHLAVDLPVLRDEQAEWPPDHPAPSRADEDYLRHPYVVLRMGGEPTTTLELLQTGETAALAQRCDDIAATLRPRAAALSARLERVLPGLRNDAARNALLAVRRNLFNLRRCKVPLVAALAGDLEPELGAAVADLARAIDDMHGQTATLADAYQQEVSQSLATLAGVFKRTNLRDGLQHTAPRLFDMLRSHFGGRAAPLNAKARRRLETTFVDYIVRSSAKTSPLSSLGTVAVQRREMLSEGGTSGVPALQRRVEINHAVMLRALLPLMADREGLASRFSLQLNTSVKVVGDAVMFLELAGDANPKIWGVATKPGALRLTPIVRAVLALFDGGRELSLDEACGELARGRTVDPGRLRDSLLSLARLGLLVPDCGFEAQGDLLAWSRSFVDRRDDAAADLSIVAQGIEDYQSASGDRRTAVRENIEAAVARMTARSGTAPSDAQGASAVFEDCFVDAQGVRGDFSALAATEADLARWLAITPLLDANNAIKAFIIRRFLDQFGVDGRCTDIAEFLTSVHREMNAGGNVWTDPHRLRAMESRMREDPVFAQLSDVKKRFVESVMEDVGSGRDVEISRETVAAAVRAMPDPIRSRGASQCFLGQMATLEDGARAFVLNRTLTGHSAMHSRFLHGVDPAGLAEVREYLRGASRHGRYAELGGAFGFNANLHPRLAESELVVPPYPPSLNVNRKIAISGVKLAFDVQTRSLCCEEPDGSRFDLFYFGFLIPAYLPPLHQMLWHCFSQAPQLYLFPEISSRVTQGFAAPSVIPRIRFGGVVLQRRTTLIPRPFLPDPALGGFEFFMAARRLREELHLPRRVFLKLSPFARMMDARAREEQPSIDWAKMDFTKFKPLYLDFDSPVLIGRFQHRLKTARFDALVEEALPGPCDPGVEIGGEPFACELQIDIALPHRVS